MHHRLLVLAQVILSAAIVLTASWSPMDRWAMMLAIPGIAIAVWAWMAIGLRNIRVHPTPTEKTRLVTSGPYRWIRHPMYSGVLWMTAALLFSNPQWWRLLAWGVLLGVLVTKATIEEREMLKRFPDYAKLQQQAGMLFPKLSRCCRSENN